ncbi:uncharacterized protein LOC362433 isoform X1 [Rattus norvegicus]|uniref:uncharacterized protein LOC362433 isoform X1 n=1 Tax=Rattus norvegicus TaxID=10116 RepID=UPI001916F11C|nr:uncharacterized protein LOC362433 isoform X1 [Rattus norvegicus]
MFFSETHSNPNPGIFFVTTVLGFIMGHCIFLFLIILVIHQCRKRRVFQEEESMKKILLNEEEESGIFLRCRCSLRNASRKDKDSIKVKMNHLGGARSLLQTPGREAPRKETTGGREDSSILVEIVGERTREVCPVTPV